MAIVRANQTVSVADPSVTRGRLVVHENDAYDDKDPVVKEYPWLFESDIERATAAPGEKRNVKRTK